jgi:hypothetical protein
MPGSRKWTGEELDALAALMEEADGEVTDWDALAAQLPNDPDYAIALAGQRRPCLAARSCGRSSWGTIVRENGNRPNGHRGDQWSDGVERRGGVAHPVRETSRRPLHAHALEAQAARLASTKEKFKKWKGE